MISKWTRKERRITISDPSRIPVAAMIDLGAGNLAASAVGDSKQEGDINSLVNRAKQCGLLTNGTLGQQPGSPRPESGPA